ncbi:alpha/beta hydrolase [Microbacterium sp. A8/3-1]|uniref:Alpha/beta hydrolase n=1 Tax=Microbacterium sp. A8/3-1 TaxID=3160749 RepID=A0AAU7VV92_9MICO
MRASASRVVRDLVYRTVDDRRLRLDIHLPDPAEGHPPVLVYLHGGGFQSGERTDRERERAAALAAHGFAVATVEYRFSDAASFPAQRDDARAAIEWLRENAGELGVNASRIGAWGASAGGHLAALLALGVPESNERPSVDAAVLWFAAVDLDAMSRGTALEREILDSGELDALLGGMFDIHDPIHRQADPLSQVSISASPLLVMTGDRDRIVDVAQSERLHNSLTAAGADSQLWILGGAGHEDDAFESPRIIGAIAAFFAHHLGDLETTGHRTN